MKTTISILLIISAVPGLFITQALGDDLDGPGEIAMPVAPNITIRPDVNISNYLALAAQPQYMPVVKIYARGGLHANTYRLAGSGVFIAPGWFLTAAHVVSFFDSGGDSDPENLSTNGLYGVTSSPFAVYLEGTVNGSNSPFVYTFSEVFTMPDDLFWQGLGKGNDLALCRFSQSGGSGQAYLTNNYVPAPMYQETSEVGHIGTWVGYGLWGTALDGGVKYDPVYKLACQNMIDTNGLGWLFSGAVQNEYGDWYIPPQDSGYFGRTWVFGPTGSTNQLVTDFDDGTDLHNVAGSKAPLPLEGSPAPGDSGGGLFIQEGGTNFLAGITSAGTCDTNGNQCSIPQGYGSIAGATRVSPWIPWINDYVNFGSFQGANGAVVPFDSPNLWLTASATNFPQAVTPGPQHHVVFNSEAIQVTNVGSIEPDGAWQQPYWPVPSIRTAYTVTFDRDRENTRLRVRRGSDLTLDLHGFTYTLTSTSRWTAALVVGQWGSDAPVLSITNGTLRAHDCDIGEWGEVYPSWNTLLIANRQDNFLPDYYKATSSGTLNVRGPTGRLQIEDSLYVGGSRSRAGGVGYLTVEPGAQLSIANILKIWYVANIAAENWDYINERSLGFRAKAIQGEATIDGIAMLGSLDIAGGTLSGRGSVTVTNQGSWRGGYILGGGKLDLLGGLAIHGGTVTNPPIGVRYDAQQVRPDLVITNPPLVIDGWSLTNHANVSLDGSLNLIGSNAPVIENLAGATLDLDVDRGIIGSGTFVNQGTFRKSGGTNTTLVSWLFQNHGTIQTESGTVLFSGLVPELTNSVLSVGTWKVLNGSTLLALQGAQLKTNRTTVVLDGTGATFTNVNTMVANEGTFTIQNGATFGASNMFLNQGTLCIGSGSTFSTVGAFQQAAAGTLLLEASSQPTASGRLVSSLPAVLDGNLQISFTGRPTQSQSIELMTFPFASGSFVSTNLPSMPDASFKVLISATNVVLNVTPATPLAITSVSIATNTAVFTWIGGSPPFTVQVTTNLSYPVWQTISEMVTDTNFSVPASNGSAYFRVLSR